MIINLKYERVLNLMRISRKKLIFIILIVLIGIIVLSTVIYQQTALWKPEQSLITLLPESPICYLTLKELEGLVNAFKRSELGKQAAQMPILNHIKRQMWWRQLVYQKLVWEYEMGGKLDMRAVKGHFGTEAILAVYQREGELSFLLITEVGGPEKLAIEALTATDAINPNYKRIQTEYNGLTINTITGYPLDFSYTFIGKIGVLSLNPLLLAEVIDIYAEKNEGFLARHPIKGNIQKSYDNDTNTAYLDISHLSAVLKSLGDNFGSLAEQISTLFGKGEFWTFGNRYEDGVIISKYRFGNPEKPVTSQSEVQRKLSFLPEQTALVTFNPDHDWTKTWKMLKDNLAIEVDSDTLYFSQDLKPEMTTALITHNEGDVSKLPSLVLHAPIKNKVVFTEDIENLKNMKITIAGTPLEFLETQEYKGITVQPVQLRLNFLLAFIGGYAIVDNHFFFSTTLPGLKSVLDTNSGDTPKLSDMTFSDNGTQTYIQPKLLVPEISRFIPIATLLASLSGQKLDAVLMQHIKNNLFPLESLGPITANVNFGEGGVDAEVQIVLEKNALHEK
ncbi:MAG: hypothetical protein OXU23_20880 [Candidatus Poribacteria bacterium]|nr:hypothetical protein [Candidatus Poribacteria bacterium]